MKKVLATLLLAAGTAHAGFISGNELYSRLTSSSPADNMLAMGYIVGIHDSGEGIIHCSPGSIIVRQITDMVKQTLQEHPQTRHLPGDFFVNMTLKTQWPCKKGSSL